MRGAPAAIILLAAGLMGCAGPGVVGNSEFSCPGYPSHPTCMSVRQMYQATEATDQVIADETGKASNKGKKVLGQSSMGVQESGMTPAEQAARVVQRVAMVRAQASGNAQVPVPHIEDPVPIRTPARVMRIWVAPWEDEAGDLHVSGYVYTEIEKRRWMVGERPAAQAARVRPLQVEHRAEAADAARAAVQARRK